MKLKFHHGDKIFFYSIGIFLLLFYPMGLFHEVGHALVCVNTGGTFPIDLFFQLRVNCDPLPSDLQTFWAMGGIFGFIGSIVPIATKKIRTTPILIGGFAGSAVLQFLYFVSETWTHYAYMGNNQILFLGITGAVVFSVFYFSRIVDKNLNR